MENNNDPNSWIKEPFQELLEGELFCSNYASIAVQYAQTQSISTSEHSVLNTCLMNTQLNTLIQALARRSNLCHLSWNVSEDILFLLLTPHCCAWISKAMIEKANTEGFALENMILQWHALSWASSLSKLRLFLLSNGKFSWMSE